TVAQRAREFATLRTLGATRRQVMRSVLLESFVLGVLASVTGLFLGLALAKGLNAVFKALSIDLPQAGTVFATRTVIVSLLLGTVITVVSSFVPARRATRVPPIAAAREGSVLPPPPITRFSTGSAWGLVVAAVASMAVGSFARGLSTAATLLLLGLGALALFIGVALVAKRLVRPLAEVIGAPGARFGGSPGRLARENSLRAPARTAATAAALMIGLALVTLVATLGAGLRDSDKEALAKQVRAQYVITSQTGFTQFPASAVRELPKVPGVRMATAVLDDNARIFGKSTRIEGIDPAAIAQAYDFQWTGGATDAVLATLGSDGAIVKKTWADDHKLKAGSSFTLLSPSGKRMTATVRGISNPPVFDKIDPLLGDVMISQQAFREHFPSPGLTLAFANLEPGASAALAPHLEQALKAFPDAKIQTRADWIAERAKGINQLLNLLYVLLALSVIVSLFGMVNTLVLSVFERTRELGMLRAVGMTRRQVRAMIRKEAILTALVGAVLGIPLGIGLAALLGHAIGYPAFTIPWRSLLVFVNAAIFVGLLAAIFPARRAARLNVLQALQYE
ncbi:MAG TPA: FtsX-like permease family protein, partial [Gaiellaceae bacterium]